MTSAALAVGDATCSTGGSQFVAVTGTTFACNGAAGPTGPQGPAGTGATSGTSSNTPNTLIERGASGEFSAGAVTATRLSVTGNANLGASSVASGLRSFAMGEDAQATGDDAVAIGLSARAMGLGSVVIGSSNALGQYAFAMGLQSSARSNFSVAIGKNARAQRQGAVVIGDACASFSSDSVYATANNQFVVRGCGGLKMYTSQNLSSGVEVAPGGSSWSSVSDRNRKELFSPTDGEYVLGQLRDIPVSSWNYKTQERSIRHMGPMAQDFHAAFGLGESNLLINSVDIDGVMMAAAQALEERTTALREENSMLRKDIVELKDRQAETERKLAELTARVGKIEGAIQAPKP
ncbi:MAG: tail fiber domain-containing protein [Gemmatimonadaceae bacterium]